MLQFAQYAPETSVSDLAATFGNSGFVADSVPLAIHAAQHVEWAGLYEMLAGSVKAGGDTDTIASMAGQIAGAWIGASRVPEELFDELPEAELVLRIAGRFANVVEQAI